MANAQQINFVKTVYSAAKSLYDSAPKDSLSPLFVTAQAALETGWKIGGIENNIFGITKGSSWTGKTQLVLTTEYFDSDKRIFTTPEKVVSITRVGDRWKYSVYRLFRVYDKLEDCLRDHLAILRKSGYSDAWQYRNDATEYARRLVDSTGAKYATAPNYASAMAATIATVQKIVDNYLNI
jgi:flagellar protein FlgJ